MCNLFIETYIIVVYSVASCLPVLFIWQVCGLLLSAAGAYGMYYTAVEVQGGKDSLELAYIVITDLSGVLLVLGILIWAVSYSGCIGALRENLCLLKLVSKNLINRNHFQNLLYSH